MAYIEAKSPAKSVGAKPFVPVHAGATPLLLPVGRSDGKGLRGRAGARHSLARTEAAANQSRECKCELQVDVRVFHFVNCAC